MLRCIGIGSNLYRCNNRNPVLVGKVDRIWNGNFNASTLNVIYGTPSSLHFVRRSLGEVDAIEKQNHAIDHLLAHFLLFLNFLFSTTDIPPIGI